MVPPRVLLAFLALPLLGQTPPIPGAPAVQAAPTLAESAEPPLVGTTEGKGTEVWVVDGDSRRKLESVPGTQGRTWAYFTTLIWADFPGKTALLRVSNSRPVFLISMEKSPRNRLLLVRCRTNTRDRNRSVKMGQAGVFTYKGLQAPDPDWEVPADIREEKPGLWRVEPRQPMEPGEYGFFSGAAAAHATKGSPVGELFEFGVDLRK